jgi:predicted ATP-grasp superfamily ATP-dependent carboligase
LSESPLIEVRTIKRANLNGGTLIDGFPSGGLTNSIASMCFMKSLRNELISVLDSSAFPPLSIIYDGIANFPARIYANKDLKVVLELHSGSVNGIPALLLNEGARRNFDVIVLLGKIIKGSSEFRSAAAISEVIMKLVPGLSCDIRDLLTRAKTIEQDLMKVRAGQKNSTINLYR